MSNNYWDDEDDDLDTIDETTVTDGRKNPLRKVTREQEKRIKELTHARHDERRAKEALLREKQELERIAQHIVEENKRLKESLNNGQQVFVSMAQDAAEAKLEKARRELKTAQEAFDTDAIIAAQEALAEAKWEVKAAKLQKPSLQPETPVVQPRYEEPQRVQPDEKTLRWQAKNQWFGATGFEEVTSFALGLHQKLVANGVDPRTDEYFEQIDARVKSKFPEVFGNEDQKTERSEAKRPSPVVAPASRSTGVKKVQLTPSQAALIKKYNLDPKKYVAEVLKLEKTNG